MAKKLIPWNDGTYNKITIDYSGGIGITQQKIYSVPNYTPNDREIEIEIEESINNVDLAKIPIKQKGNTPIPITLFANPPEAGVVLADPSIVMYGEKSTIQAIPNPRYKLINWDSGEMEEIYIKENITEPYTDTANFSFVSTWNFGSKDVYFDNKNALFDGFLG